MTARQARTIEFSGEVLRRAREKAGLTRRNLSVTMDIAETTVRDWEVSDRPPNSRYLPALAKALGIGINDLFE